MFEAQNNENVITSKIGFIKNIKFNENSFTVHSKKKEKKRKYINNINNNNNNNSSETSHSPPKNI